MNTQIRLTSQKATSILFISVFVREPSIVEEKDYGLLPSILDIAKENLHLRTARIILRRMGGASLRDISVEEGITRSEARSTEKSGLERLFSSCEEVREDAYRYLYEHYHLEDEFYESLPDGTRILYYLKNRYEPGLGSYERAMEDPLVSQSIQQELSHFYLIETTNPLSEEEKPDISVLKGDAEESLSPAENESGAEPDQTESEVNYLSEEDNYDFDVLPQYVKDAINNLWNAFQASGITEENKILEQAGLLLFLKYLDDAELRNTAEAFSSGIAVKNLYFDAAHQNCRWSSFHDLEAMELLRTMQSDVMPFVKRDLRVDSEIAYAKLLSNVHLAITDASQLSRIVACIDAITVSAHLSLSTVLEALIRKASYDPALMDLTSMLLDAGLNDTVCNIYPDVDYGLETISRDLSRKYPEELEKVWNRMHFRQEMFHTFGTDGFVLRMNALSLLFQGIDSPEMAAVDVLDSAPSVQYSKVVAKIPAKAVSNPNYVRPSIKKMIGPNLPSLMYMYACHEALAEDGICILNTPHKNLSDVSASHIRLRELYVKGNTVTGAIYIPSLGRDLLIYRKSAPSSAYNVWFFKIEDLRKCDLEKVASAYLSRDEDVDNERAALSFMVPSSEIEAADYSLDYERYSVQAETETENYDDVERLDDVLRRIYNTQAGIDRHIAKAKELIRTLQETV